MAQSEQPGQPGRGGPEGHRPRIQEGSLDPVFVVNSLEAKGFQSIHEPGLGHGYAVAVGHDDTEARVGVFPQVHAVQVVSGSSILRLERIIRTRRRDDLLQFEALEQEEKVTLEISPEGRFVLTRQPLDPDNPNNPTAIAQTMTAETTETVQSPTSSKRHREERKPRAQREQREKPAEQRTEQKTERPADATENERVTVRGRVGKEARFRASGRRGMLIGSFPLGEHPDLETTVWHTVVVFGDRAAKLKEKGLTAGQEIEIVGYVHERQIQGNADQPAKTVREIYATAIRTTLKKPTE